MHALLHREAFAAQGQADGVLGIAAHLHEEYLDGKTTTITALPATPCLAQGVGKLDPARYTPPDRAGFSGIKHASYLVLRDSITRNVADPMNWLMEWNPSWHNAGVLQRKDNPPHADRQLHFPGCDGLSHVLPLRGVDGSPFLAGQPIFPTFLY